jgi:hypothetical protein
VKFTPSWLVQMIADGALGLIYVFPNVIGLLLYAVGVFILIDALMAQVTKPFTRRVAAGVLAEDSVPVDAKAPRIRAYLPIALGWLLKLWIGAPMLYLFNMMVSENPEARQTLATLIGGYRWQADALHRLPLPFWPSLKEGELPALVLQAAVILAFFVFRYWYASSGFALVRRVRKVGDALVARIGSASITPSPQQALSVLRTQGWDASSIKSAAFFLSLMRMRIMWVSPVYDQLSARQYGLFQVLQDIGVAGALLALHPVASALYVAFKLKGGKKMIKTRRVCLKNLSNLPSEIQSQSA